MWTPHVYLVNEQQSVIMGADKKDMMLTVEPDGTVVLSARLVPCSVFRWLPKSAGNALQNFHLK
jgi:hypothetical protein